LLTDQREPVLVRRDGALGRLTLLIGHALFADGASLP
jgi:hypothetical protein